MDVWEIYTFIMSMTNNNKQPPGMHQPYNFDIKELLSRAYRLSGENNWTLAQLIICILLITFAAYFIFIDAYGITNIESLLSDNSPLLVSQQATIELSLTCLLAPLWTGVAMLAIRFNRSEKPSVTDAFAYYKNFILLAAASVILSILFTVGLSLYIVPGFYIFTATTFTLPLIIDKKMSPIAAIISSIKMVNRYLSKMLALYGVFLLMFLLVILSFGIAYLWVGPLYFNVKAILYEDLFCEAAGETNELKEETNNGVFNA